MISALILSATIMLGQVPAKTSDVPQYLQNISVTLRAKHGQGSGIIKTRGDVNYIWTAGHVIADNKKTREVIDPKSGSKKFVIDFDDVSVIKELYQDGRSVGRIEMLAEVIRYSDADEGDDLALLRVRKKNFVIKDSVVFNDDKNIPAVGIKLWHCGSLLGQDGSNSVTTGLLSQVGRVLFNKPFDQTSCSAFPGSSGGGIYLENGKCIGILVRGAGESFNLIVPLRRVRQWADKVGVMFAIDDSVPVPDEKTLHSKPVEDSLNLISSGERAASKISSFKFMIIKDAK